MSAPQPTPRPLAPARPFDLGPVLSDDTLLLRPLVEADIPALAAAAASPTIWEQHPARERHKWEVFEPFARSLIALGGTLVFVERDSGTIIGCSRFYVGPDAPEDIAIGFTFLNDAWWGGATNRRVKALMLGHAFATFDRVWFHIAPTNIRSQRATEKLGAVRVAHRSVDLGVGPAEYFAYALDRDVWRAGLGTGLEAAR